MAAINQLRSQGYNKKQIAEKTGLTVDYIGGVLVLIDKGEERLLIGVESGRIPLTVAMQIVPSTSLSRSKSECNAEPAPATAGVG